MDFEILGTPGWREGLIAIIVLLVIYVAMLLMRLRRLQNERQAVSTQAANAAMASYAAMQSPLASPEPPAVAAPSPVEESPPAPPLPPPPAAALTVGEAEQTWSEPAADNPTPALLEALQQELYQLRCEVDELRAEVLAARKDVRQQLSHSIDAPPPPSPQYNDAMQMASEGHDATAIAHQCHISRAEADLVVALARNRGEGLSDRRRAE